MAERFELYACGVELANGFGELTDPDEQRARFEREMAEEGNASMASAIRWTRISWPRWRRMPPASGVALGFDRLVMLATGAPNIDEVLWTPLAVMQHGRHDGFGWRKTRQRLGSRRHD